MIPKREIVLGKEVNLELGFIQALHNFFGTPSEQAKPVIRMDTPEYRFYRKKIVSEGKLTRWREVQPIREKARR